MLRLLFENINLNESEYSFESFHFTGFLKKAVTFPLVPISSSSISCLKPLISLDGVIIISTPQEIALQDVKRGIRMFDKLGTKIIGLVDNMSHFIGDDGKKYAIFGEGGVKKTAKEFNKEFLGEIPINPEVGKQGDLGKPIVESNPTHEISKIYLKFAEKIKLTYL